uniref:Atg8e n=1 Tax=Arundo donax TaxID=35708 RepID=A0A0A9GCA5_ARUDO
MVTLNILCNNGPAAALMSAIYENGFLTPSAVLSGTFTPLGCSKWSRMYQVQFWQHTVTRIHSMHLHLSWIPLSVCIATVHLCLLLDLCLGLLLKLVAAGSSSNV